MTKLATSGMDASLDFSKKESASASTQVSLDGDTWEAQQLQAQSSTNIEADKGEGDAAVIRMFEFKANPIAFREHKPTKQELFNAHLKGIEVMLWRDGLKINDKVSPSLRISKDKTRYRIYVAANPAKGHLLPDMMETKTLSQLVHGK